jgi:hypothetical protein
MIAGLLCFLGCQLHALDFVHKKPHEITIDIKIDCPMSEELANFVKSIPDHQSTNFDEWKASFINSLTQLIQLVESEKVYSSYWSVNIDDALAQKVMGE